jgi:hypothetical protein
LPDGNSILFSASRDRNDWDSATIVAESMASGARTVLVQGGNEPRLAVGDHLVYARGAGLYAVGFDASTLTVTGGEQPIAEGVDRAQFRTTPAANYGVSADGTLLYARATERSDRLFEIVTVDRAGSEQPLGIEPCNCFDPIVSPDGSRVAVHVLARDMSDEDIWVWSMAQRTLTRLTKEAGFEDGPVWSPDSRQIVYRTADGTRRRRADGVGEPTTLTSGAVLGNTAYGYTPDGSLIIGRANGSALEIGLLAPGDDAQYETLLSNGSRLTRAALSPSGRWLAYQSNESGRNEIYVQPFPNVDAGKWLVSSGGGAEPLWGADDTELFFRSPTHLMVTRVNAGADDFRFAPPEALFDTTAYRGGDGGPPRHYSVTPDGQRFLFARIAAGGRTGTGSYGRLSVVIVQNWAAELKRPVATN